jgi:hypothetical protein
MIIFSCLHCLEWLESSESKFHVKIQTFWCSKYVGKFRSLSSLQGKTSKSHNFPTAWVKGLYIPKIHKSISFEGWKKRHIKATFIEISGSFKRFFIRPWICRYMIHSMIFLLSFWENLIDARFLKKKIVIIERV